MNIVLDINAIIDGFIIGFIVSIVIALISIYRGLK
jgi:hypothetical protein